MDRSHDVVVLDGGMSRELQRVGAPFRQPEWSAVALAETPELVELVHRDFIAAGADVVTTNTFAVVPFHLGEERFATDGAELAHRAGAAARRAADAADRPVEVAGCLPPPLGAYLPERFDEQTGRAVWEVLVLAQRALIDLWLVETLSSTTEAVAALDLLDDLDPGRPRWVAFCLAEGEDLRLRSGEALVDGADAVAGRCHAVLVACSTPEQIDAAVPALRGHLDGAGQTDTTVGAYANLFEGVAGDGRANEVVHAIRPVSPTEYAARARRWVADGSGIVGGCCGVGHEHIAAIAAACRTE